MKRVAANVALEFPAEPEVEFLEKSLHGLMAEFEEADMIERYRTLYWKLLDRAPG